MPYIWKKSVKSYNFDNIYYDKIQKDDEVYNQNGNTLTHYMKPLKMNYN